MKLILLFVCCLLLPVILIADAYIPVGITYDDQGIATIVDSIRLNVVLYPTGTDTTFLLNPTTVIWDTIINITGTVENYASLQYNIYEGTDTTLAVEFVELRYDTSKFKNAVWLRIQSQMETQGGFLYDLVSYWGACEGCYVVYYPNDGTTPKDSVVMYNMADVKIAKVTYFHNNVNTVLDTSLFRSP